MNSFLDGALVGVLLLCSAGYAFAALGPRNLRQRVLTACSEGLRSAPAALRLHRAAHLVALAAQSKPRGACGGCDDCGTGAPGTGTPAAGGATEPAATEVRVPIASIGRVRR